MPTDPIVAGVDEVVGGGDDDACNVVVLDEVRR